MLRWDQSSTKDQGKSYFWVRLVAIGLLVGGAMTASLALGQAVFFLIGLHVILGMGLVHATANAKVLNLASNLAVYIRATVGTIAYTLAVPCALATYPGKSDRGTLRECTFGPHL